MRIFRSRFTRRGALLAALATIAFAGCTDFSSTPDVLGHLIVTAKDESGAPVPGMNFTALLSDRIQEWAKVTTGTSGSAEFRAKDGGILPQTYVIRFDGNNGGYALASGETNDKPAVVVLGQTLTITFTLRKLGPSGP
jgi:type II secretory pathway pseudopilin PulG